MIRDPRAVKSFVRRQGRLSTAQNQALKTLLPVYGLDTSIKPFDFSAIFGKDVPVVLEIGFGNGESLASMAAEQTETGFLGIEVHTPGVGNLLQQIQDLELHNVRVVRDDAFDVITRNIPARSLDRVQVFFPDPWHKKRHQKRRIINPEFAELLATRLKSGALVHLATDWDDYAQQMLQVFSENQNYENQAVAGQYLTSPHQRQQTRFEQRGIRLGHKIRDIVFKRK